MQRLHSGGVMDFPTKRRRTDFDSRTTTLTARASLLTLILAVLLRADRVISRTERSRM